MAGLIDLGKTNSGAENDLSAMDEVNDELHADIRKLKAERDILAQRLQEAERLLGSIGERCQQRDMPGEQVVSEWADKIDAFLAGKGDKP